MLVCPRCHLTYLGDMERCGLDGEPLVKVDRDPMLGRTLGDHSIQRPLGAGGMGRVYLAKHARLPGRLVAVKVLVGEMASNPRVAARFRREGEIASKMRHPNIASVIDFGTTDEGITYLSMEYVEGRTLRAILNDGVGVVGRRAENITRQIALGLAHAHALGYVHRDLKPANVVVTPDGEHDHLKVLDFGIARSYGEGDPQTQLTQTGMLIGTPRYMAPEQAQGDEATPAIDIYALGVTLYEMVAGRAPFTGTTPRLLVQHAVDEPPPLPEADGLGPLALMMLAKDRDVRPTAMDVVRRVEAITAARSAIARPLAPPPPAKRRVLPYVLGAVLLAAAAVVTAGSWTSSVLPAPVVSVEHTPMDLPSRPVAAVVTVDEVPKPTITRRTAVEPRAAQADPPKRTARSKRSDPLKRKDAPTQKAPPVVRASPPPVAPPPEASLPEAPAPTTGRVRITTSMFGASAEAGAPILVDGRRAGVAPLTLILAAGSHRIEARPRGLPPRRRVVEVRPGDIVDAALKLCAASDEGRLFVTARETDGTSLFGEIFVDGERRGTAPGRITIPACRVVRVLVRTAGGTELAASVEVEPKQIKRVVLRR